MPDKYFVSGSSAQPTINGIYEKTSQNINGHPYYLKGAGSQQKRTMYWTPDAGGKWVITEEYNKNFYAVEPDGSTPIFGPVNLDQWLTLVTSWQSESSVTVKPVTGVQPSPLHTNAPLRRYWAVVRQS